MGKSENDCQSGRPRVHIPENFSEIVAAVKEGKLDVETAARIAGMSRATFYRKLQDISENKICLNCRYRNKAVRNICNDVVVCMNKEQKDHVTHALDMCRYWEEDKGGQNVITVNDEELKDFLAKWNSLLLGEEE